MTDVITDEPSLRATLRAFAAAHHPGRPPRERSVRIRWQQDWCRRLFDAGLAGPSWPRAFGGLELPVALQAGYHEEYARLRLPAHPGNGPGIAGPTLIRYGTQDQQRRYLAAMLRADQIWAQGFSEPEAGSDLASLRTRARREGDSYLVTGEKIWSSYADVAQMMVTLVRTGSRDAGRDAITYLLIDLRSPGVSVSPIRDLTGGTQFSAVHLQDVAVPVAERVGEENAGWQLARVTLGHERAARSLAQSSAYARRFSMLLTTLRDRGVLDDPVARERVGALAVRVQMLRLNAVRTVARIERDGDPGPGSSLIRLELSMLEQQLFEVAVETLGRDALLLDDAGGVDGGRWARGLLATRGSTIGAGTAQVQRTTIAERLLGLPADPSSSSDR